MPKQKDPSITFLNKFGYNVVKLPRVGIEPMDVVGRDQTTQWLGPLRSVWTSTVPEPAPTAPRPVSALAGQKTDQMDIRVGLKILANALAAFGASIPSLDFAYAKARKVQFSYTNVTSTAVAPLDAGNFLAKGQLSTDNPVVKHYLTSQDTQAFLIVDVLKSDSISVVATDSQGLSVGVDVPAIQGVLGAGVAVKTGQAGDGAVTFTGTKPATFGFIVDEIHFDGEKWSLSGTAPSGDIAFRVHAGAGAASPEPAASPILLGTGCTVQLI